MFSSLASYLFGSNTNCETKSETTAAATGEKNDNIPVNLIDANNLIEVTSLTPSVTGKRGKNRRNKRKGIQNNINDKEATLTPLTSNQTKTLTPSSTSGDEEEFNEDDWFIVEKEDAKESDSSNRIDSEEEIVPLNEVVKNTKSSSLAQQRRPPHISSHSLYSGPRPQKQRNYLQKSRNSNNNRGYGLSASTLSPSRIVDDGRNGSGPEATADCGIVQSLCAAAMVTPQSDENSLNAANGIETLSKMDESWFITPPPCFTSVGPFNIETSPYENLLIEHPSMSVYCSIRKAQENVESFVNLDIGTNSMTEEKNSNETTPKKNRQVAETRSPRSGSGSGHRLDRQYMVQLKQELMARNEQNVQNKNEHKDFCRTAIKRANKVRDVQSKNHTQRRSDRQHSKIFSQASNNRKTNCC